MAGTGAVWTRSSALRIPGELASAGLALPRRSASMALAMGARLGAALVGGRMLRRSYLGPLIERSRVLAGATVTLHQVRSASPTGWTPSRPDAALHYHVLDVTVRPRPTRRGLQRWSPADLVLVAPGALPSRPEEDREVGRIFRAERWHRGRFVEAGGTPLFGPQRLRLHVGLIPSARQFHFRYYLELLRRHPD